MHWNQRSHKFPLLSSTPPQGIQGCGLDRSWMEQKPQPYRELGNGFSSQACSGWVGPQAVSVPCWAGRAGTLLAAIDKQSLACPLQHHWVFKPAAWVAQARGFISSAQAVGVSGGEVRSNEISAALKFTSKYLIREMFDFNNKWAEYQETLVLAKYIYGKVFTTGAFFGLPS